MGNKIHKSAIIGDNVKIGENNIICSNVVLEGNIEIGDNNYLGPNSVLINNVKLGNENKFYGSISIGTPGEMGTKGDILLDDGIVEIGDNNVFREFITINSPVRKKSTLIGNNCYLMARTHIPHDATLCNNVVMATNSLIGGGVYVEDYAYIGLGSITHQWNDIGESALIGLQAGVTKNIPPFCIATGVPAKILKFNKVGAERRGFESDIIQEVELNFKNILIKNYISNNLIVNKIITFIDKHESYLKEFII